MILSAGSLCGRTLLAFDNSELATTELVTHTIDTGDHRPIKQPLRRTPFALRTKIDQLVQEKLDYFVSLHHALECCQIRLDIIGIRETRQFHGVLASFFACSRTKSCSILNRRDSVFTLLLVPAALFLPQKLPVFLVLERVLRISSASSFSRLSRSVMMVRITTKTTGT